MKPDPTLFELLVKFIFTMLIVGLGIGACALGVYAPIKGFCLAIGGC